MNSQYFGWNFEIDENGLHGMVRYMELNCTKSCDNNNLIYIKLYL